MITWITNQISELVIPFIVFTLNNEFIIIIFVFILAIPLHYQYSILSLLKNHILFNMIYESFFLFFKVEKIVINIVGNIQICQLQLLVELIREMHPRAKLVLQTKTNPTTTHL